MTVATTEETQRKAQALVLRKETAKAHMWEFASFLVGMVVFLSIIPMTFFTYYLIRTILSVMP